MPAPEYHFTGKAYHTPAEPGQLWECKYSTDTDYITEVWEVIEPRRSGWIMVYLFMRITRSKTEPEKVTHIRGNRDHTLGYRNARRHVSQVDLDGNLHHSLRISNGKKEEKILLRKASGF